MLISSTALWIGCLFIYLSSPNQKILQQYLPKKMTYWLFSFCVVLSWFFLLPEYSGVIAGLVILAQIMVMWPSTVFILSHTKPTVPVYVISGAVFFSLLSLLGGIA